MYLENLVATCKLRAPRSCSRMIVWSKQYNFGKDSRIVWRGTKEIWSGQWKGCCYLLVPLDSANLPRCLACNGISRHKRHWFNLVVGLVIWYKVEPNPIFLNIVQRKVKNQEKKSWRDHVEYGPINSIGESFLEEKKRHPNTNLRLEKEIVSDLSSCWLASTIVIIFYKC